MSEPNKPVPPPEDVAAERALLGSILLGGRQTLIPVLTLLGPEDFTRDLHRRAFAAMVRLHERGEDIDAASVSGEMQAGEDGLDQPPIVELAGFVVDVPTVLHAPTYAKAVRRCAVARRVISAASQMAGLAWNREEEATLMSDVQAVLDKLFASQTGGTILTPKELAAMHFDVLDRRSQNDPDAVGIPTGFSDLDRYIAYRPGELIYIAASPGIGKTTLMTNMQDLLAHRGVASLFASAEQPAIQLMDRAVASEARVDSWKIARGDLSLDEWSRVNSALSARSLRPTYVYDDPSMTTARLTAAAQLAKARYGVKVVFVDYVQLLADTSSESEYVRVSTISRRLAQLARSLSVCVVAACQVSRKGAEVDGQIPRLAELRGSGSLEQDAFVVLAIGRKEADPEAQVAVRKNRNGLAGVTVPLHFDAEHVRFLGTVR